MIVIVAVGGVIALGIILIVALLCALLCHRAKETMGPLLSNKTSTSSTMNRIMKCITLHPMALPSHNGTDISEPATEPEYFSITDTTHSQPRHSETNYRGSLQPPENELEYLYIRSEIEHTYHQSALNVHMHHPLGPSGVIITENEPEYLSVVPVKFATTIRTKYGYRCDSILHCEHWWFEYDTE